MTAIAGERMYPILPCRDLDEAIAFYEALGFERTYRQVRPNPHAVVARGDLAVHLAGIEGFDPEQSYASVIIVVPDPDALYASFAAGLRAAYGRLPVSGIPRMVRPRKRWGTVYGFSVVDVGGNWLRFSRIGDTEEAVDESEPGLGERRRRRRAPRGLAWRRRRRPRDARTRVGEVSRRSGHRAGACPCLPGRPRDPAGSPGARPGIAGRDRELDLDAGERAGLAAELDHVEALLR